MSEIKALRTIPFDGKTSSYVNWSKRFQSLCTIKDCDQALLQDYADNLIHDETTTLNSKDEDFVQKEKIIKANRLFHVAKRPN
jgi:hypothetical protein